MVDREEISRVHKSGFNCAQVVAYFCRDINGAQEKDVLAAMGGFGGGLRSGEVCGALAGAVYSLGLCFPYNDNSDVDSKMRIAELTKKIAEQFKDEFNYLTCRELVDAYTNARCEEFMARAVDIVHEIVENEKGN